MRTSSFAVSALAVVAQVYIIFSPVPSFAQDKYPTMAPLAQYLMQESDEIAFAKSAAPKSVSDNADVMVLKPDGYATVVKGTNGFVCFVERGWAGDSTFPDYWNPKQRAPNCFNAAAARSFAQIYLMKTKLALQGKSKAEITKISTDALASKELPPLEPGAMCYMMSHQQYLNDHDKHWHPHLMFFVAGDSGKTWGADLPGSPLMAINDPEEGVTIMLMVADHWSDGTPGPGMAH